MDRILKILKKGNGPRTSSAPALELNTIIFKHVYWYMQLISGERLQDHWSSVFMPPTLKKLEGHIAFGLSVCVCVWGGGWMGGCVGASVNF